MLIVDPTYCYQHRFTVRIVGVVVTWIVATGCATFDPPRVRFPDNAFFLSLFTTVQCLAWYFSQHGVIVFRGRIFLAQIRVEGEDWGEERAAAPDSVHKP